MSFGLFAGIATLYVAAAGLRFLGVDLPNFVETRLGHAAALTGVVGVICSIMIYVDTRRVFWNGLLTTVKFFGTAALLGVPTALLIALGAGALSDLTLPGNESMTSTMAATGLSLCQAVMLLAAGKLLFECMIFCKLRDRRHTPLKRSALLLTGDLGQ